MRTFDVVEHDLNGPRVVVMRAATRAAAEKEVHRRRTIMNSWPKNTPKPHLYMELAEMKNTFVTYWANGAAHSFLATINSEGYVQSINGEAIDPTPIEDYASPLGNVIVGPKPLTTREYISRQKEPSNGLHSDTV